MARKPKRLKVLGEKDVLFNLNKEIQKIEGGTKKGLRAAGIFVQGQAIEITPVSLGGGPLSNSSFVSLGEVGGRSVVRIGYTKEYAPFVHEMPESNNFTKTGTGPKFLEKAIFRNIRQILSIIQSRARIQ